MAAVVGMQPQGHSVPDHQPWILPVTTDAPSVARRKQKRKHQGLLDVDSQERVHQEGLFCERQTMMNDWAREIIAGWAHYCTSGRPLFPRLGGHHCAVALETLFGPESSSPIFCGTRNSCFFVSPVQP
jgi:hypothetical protein